MWICLNNAFYSIVQHESRPNLLVVRARKKGDIEQYFPEAEVLELPRRDYRFRTFVEREQVAKVLADCAMNIDYGNFKNSVAEEDRHDTYFQVWEALWEWQEGLKRQEKATCGIAKQSLSK